MNRKPAEDRLRALRVEIDTLNGALLDLLSRRSRVAVEISDLKQVLGWPVHDPAREAAMIEALRAANRGPLDHASLMHLFGELFKATASLMERRRTDELVVCRRDGRADAVVVVGPHRIGGELTLIAGPCAVESGRCTWTPPGARE